MHVTMDDVKVLVFTTVFPNPAQPLHGLFVAERVRSKWGATPIILISGYDPKAVALRAEKLCISNFLEKPFSRAIICEVVKKAIGAQKAALELPPIDPPASPTALGGHPLTRFWQRLVKRPQS